MSKGNRNRKSKKKTERLERKKAWMDCLAKGMKEEVEKRSSKIVGQFNGVEDGWSFELDDRPSFYEALDKAQEEGVPLVAPTWLDLICHKDYDPVYNPDIRPTAEQWGLLEAILQQWGVEVYFLLDPDASPRECEEFRRKLAAGQHLSGATHHD